MSFSTRRLAFGLLAGIATLGVGSLGFGMAAAQAQAWPTKGPITIVVPFPAGGTTDVTARTIAAELTKSLGQNVIVENKPGANGNIGSGQVAKSAPDGYTLLMIGVGSNAVNHGIYKSMPYDSNKDFAHITIATTGPNVLLVHPSVPAKNLTELLAYIKANDGKLSYASAGNGASGHMAMELLKTSTGLNITHIPYRGGNPALQDVIGGHVPMMFTNQDLAFAQATAGTLRAIGVASLERNPAAPEIPTIAEQGFPGFAAVSWNGLAAPAGTPKAIIDRLHAEVKKALHQPETKAKLAAQGFVVENPSPDVTAKFVADEITKWTKVAKSANVVIE